MSKLYNGGASFGFSLNYNTAVPVDTRIVVATLADLKDPKTWVSGTYNAEDDAQNVYTVYPGLAVAVTAEKTVYVFSSDVVNGTTLAADASWSRLSTGSSTSEVQGNVEKVQESVGLGTDGSHQATSGNYTSEATTVVGEIAALDAALKSTNDTIGTADDTKDSETVFGKIAKEASDRQAAIEALDAELEETSTDGHVTVGLTEEDGVVTGLTVETSDIASAAEVAAEKAKMAASKTIGEVTTGSGDDAVTSYETKVTLKYVAATTGENAVAAHIALLDKDQTELSKIEVSDIIGNGILDSSSYSPSTGILSLVFKQADGSTKTAKVDLKKMLDIDDVLINESSTDYLDVVLAEPGETDQNNVSFSVKLKNIAEATETATGLADAYDVKTYVDSKATDLAVSAEGDDYITAGVDSGDNKKINVSADVQDLVYTATTESKAADLTGTQKSLLDGKQAAEAIKSYVDDVVGVEKAAREAADSSIIGTAADTKDTLTLNGLKAFASDAAATAQSNAEATAQSKDEALEVKLIGATGSTKDSDTITGAKLFTTDAVGTLKTELIGNSGTDTASSLTIEGAKKYTDALETKLVGTEGDESGALTLNGLSKAIADSNSGLAQEIEDRTNADAALLGVSTDATDKMTINGVKNYMVEALSWAELEVEETD